jgi:hypothetical protein
MSDEPMPGGAQPPAYPAAEPPTPPEVQPPQAPPDGWQPAAAGGAVAAAPAAVPAKKPSRVRTIIVFAVILGIIGVVLYLARNNVSGDSLKVGDCFTLPEAGTFKTVEKASCTETHNAEVVYVGEYSGDTYPIAITLDNYIDDQCVPAWEAYVGRPIDSDPPLSLGYITPTRSGWDGGDRTITCYAMQPDNSPMTQSLKGT